MTENEVKVAEAIARVSGAVVPEVIEWIAELIKSGHSEEEALEIINIQSRREQYEREKAEDLERLAAKHRP